MKVTVKYFASIRESAGTECEVMELDPMPITVDALRAMLCERGPNMGEALSTDRVVRTAVNMELRSGSYLLHDGCEVAFFPPVTGG